MKGDGARPAPAHLRARTEFTSGSLFVKQGAVGLRYDEIPNSYQITLVGYTVFDDDFGFVREFSMRDIRGEILAGKMNVIYVEIGKSEEIMAGVRAKDKVAMWAAFLSKVNDPEYDGLMEEIAMENKDIGLAKKMLGEISRDKNELALFEQRRRARMDRDHDMAVSRDEGREEGKEEEKAKNIVKMRKAIEEEKAKNTVEIRKAIEKEKAKNAVKMRKTIENLSNRGFDNQEIAEILELSSNDIAELRKGL
jgi:hypothetical protein